MWLSFERHRPCSPSAHAPDPPPFLQLCSYLSAWAGAGTGELAPLAVMQWGKVRRKRIFATRVSTSLLTVHLHKPLLKDDAGVGSSAQWGQGGRAAQDTAQEKHPGETAASAVSERSTWGHSVSPTRTLLVSTWAASFWVSFCVVFPMAIAVKALRVPRSCGISRCLFLDENTNVWSAYYRGIGNFRSLPGRNMAEFNLSHRSASVSCSSEGRKGLTPHWIHFCLSRVLAASVWKACIVSLCFVIRFPMVVSVTYLTLFELIKPGNQGKHISGGDLLPKDISAEGEKKEISLYVQHSWAVS